MAEIRLHPAVIHPGQSAELLVRSAGADSIVFESANGIDRFWAHGAELRVPITADFGDPVPVVRYADRRGDALLDVLRKPARVEVCRQGRCREYYHEIPVRLSERNSRSIAVAAGWSSIFARRSIRGAGRTVLFEEALTSGIWTVEAQVADHRWNALVQGFAGGGERGASVDLSRVVKRGEGMSYGVAMHLGTIQSEWLYEGRTPSRADRTAYRASIGPSIMLKGITASSQLGVYTDGSETLQISSTRVSINGNLTSVRHPVTVTVEKTFAFGGGAVVSRRRDALERLTAGIRLVDAFAINVGVSSHRIAWPEPHPADDLKASETVLTLGGQYSVSW